MLLGIVFTFGAALLSSVGYIFIRQGLETIGYKTFIISSILAGVFVSGSTLWIRGIGLSGLTLNAVWPFIITGGLGGGLLVRICIARATGEIGASKTHAIVSAAPLITGLVGITLLGEILTPQLTLGILIIVTGASLLSYLSHQKSSSDIQAKSDRPSAGLGLAFYAMIGMGVQPLLQKKGLESGATPLQGMFIYFAAAMICYTFYLALARPTLEFDLRIKTSPFLLASAAWAIAPLLKLYALELISATIFASLFRVAPLFTVIFTSIFLKEIEEINWKICLSTFFIVVGAILISTA